MEPRHVTLLVNPASGRGRAGRAAREAQDILVSAGMRADLLEGADAADAADRARRAVASGTDALIACGGDGTVHLALQAVMGSATALGIVPLGSGNDIARALGIPRGDVAAAAEPIVAWREREVDVGEVTTDDGHREWFLAVVSAGFDSEVNERANRMAFPPGQAKYLTAIVAELGVFEPLPYTLWLDGAREDVEGMLVAVGNGTSYGGGMKVCPGARIDDGELSVMLLAKVSKPTFLRVFPRVFRGTHISHPAVSERSAREVRIEAPGQVAYADGERIGPLPVSVGLAPRALTVLT